MSPSSKKLRIAIASAECVPFSKVGGLADVVGALPPWIARDGHDVTVLTPWYGEIDVERFGIEPLALRPAIAVEAGGESYPLKAGRTVLPGTEVQVVLLGNPELFDRRGIYTDPRTGKAWPDEDLRLVFFNRAILAVLHRLAGDWDVLHCNDFHTALVPAYLRTGLVDSAGGLDRAGVLFSIHNLAYQGTFPAERLDRFGFSREHFRPGGPLEFYGRINLMKTGLVFADVLNTVSPTYAEEIQSGEEYGHGLEGVLKSRSGDLYGIMNGVDYDTWDPSVDGLLPVTYSAGSLAGKDRNKAALQERMGLPANLRVPVVGMVSRMVDQKGFDILAEGMERIVAMNVQLVVLGTGDPRYQELFAKLAGLHADRVAVEIGFVNELAHLIEAGSDFFLMPSRYEPCGLNQLYSLRYGTLPVVRATGGLKDSVRDLDEDPAGGNGFRFARYRSEELVDALARAVRFYERDGNGLAGVRRRIMGEDWSWGRSAGRYVELYQRAQEKRRSDSAPAPVSR
jgi:starch synthase